MNRLRNLDAYPKINEDFYKRTLSGGVITLVSSVVMLILFFSELRLYMHPVTETQLRVDTTRGEKLRINFDVTFPALQCSIISIDTMDISGERHLDVTDDACCNSCEEVREAYRKKGWGLSDPESIDQCKREGYVQKVKDEEGEGCNVHGFVEVNKVAGNFHFVPGQSFHQSGFQFHDMVMFQQGNYNISHKVNRLAFGDFFPGVVNPLDGVQWNQDKQNGVYQYFIKVVPTVYTDVHGKTIQSNQFSVTEHFQNAEAGRMQSPPGVFFYYDLSPIKVIFEEQHVEFLHFLTNVCAIVGGIFTVSGIVDSFIYHGQRAIKKKMEIGKFN
ncbi:hypothetical protein F2Q70_00020357 [Brassica cretica]|uniref:Endoplasmic reticulum vesicle transporter C-terminal domain-containing protein n=1 Tax=Brassica cretica TaxID=69181 RepID=A0A8S9GKK6_BRACR|nr:hypothetical protein F2Q70_00020357 [Brassica cretica]